MEKFMKINEIGDLWVDKVFFECNYPMLFTCLNEDKEMFLCTCCQANRNGMKWLLTKTTPQIVIGILKDMITLRDAFVKNLDSQISVLLYNGEYIVTEHNTEDWDYETSIYLPDKDEYLEADEGEFDEEIAYYELMMDYSYNEIKTKKVSVRDIEPKLQIEEEIKEHFDEFCATEEGNFKVSTYEVGEITCKSIKFNVDKLAEALINSYYSYLENTGNTVEDKSKNLNEDYFIEITTNDDLQNYAAA